MKLSLLEFSFEVHVLYCINVVLYDIKVVR